MDRLSSIIWLCGLPGLLALVTWRAITCPYTKVEESFTMQAMHDMLSYGVGPQALSRYDHQVFPGAVPRSFIGPFLLASLSDPFTKILRLLGVVKTSADVQTVTRTLLGAINVAAITFFIHLVFAPAASAYKKTNDTSKSHRRHALLFLLMTGVQFHFAFWATRTIPNSIALPFVVTAMALVCRNIDTSSRIAARTSLDASIAISLLTFSAVVLRLEIVATLIPTGLYLLATGRISVLQGLLTGIVSGSLSILATVIVDTYFWQDLTEGKALNILSVFISSLRSLFRQQGLPPLWPELNAILFNVVEGKSSEWGVSPWHAYFTSLMPKLLAFTTPFVVSGALQLLRGPVTVLEARARFLLAVAITHISILSMLGHKEWRFAFYVLPALNAVAAIGANSLASRLSGKVFVAVLLLLQVGLSWFTGHVSAMNYPGGEALKLLHESLGTPSERVIVHIDVLPAMTGVTLFQSLHIDRNHSQTAFAGVPPRASEAESCWIYDKTENLPLAGPEARKAWSVFTHLLTEALDCAVLRHDSAKKASALPESQQLFEPIAPPISSYVGLRRKNLPQTERDILSLPKALGKMLLSARKQRTFDSVIRLALPVVIVEEPAVWLCRRKQ